MLDTALPDAVLTDGVEPGAAAPVPFTTLGGTSTITFIDGEKGILRYRGYPIEQLAEKSSFLEVAWLLLEGELPTRDQLAAFTAS